MARSALVQRNLSRSASLPAPVGGWNARDSLGDMEPTDAVAMTNFFPGTNEVIMRAGYSEHATGLPGQVESIMVYASPSGTTEMFAASGGAIYDVTVAGAVGAAVVSGLTNDRWQHVNISTSGGNFLYAVNGEDKPLLYDGAAWTPIDGVSTPAITGVTTTDLVHVMMHKNRLWFTQKNTLKAWYLGTNAVGGAAAAFDLSSVADWGGYLMAMATWTIDAGYGVDDLAAFLTSEGEIIVYRGTDPSTANTWALVGVWQVGSPIGRRCFLKYAGDLLVICNDGVLPMSAALQSSRTNPKVALTDKIQWAVSESVTAYGANFGWELMYFPRENQLYLNVPVQEGATQQQYVMNSITKNWCNFDGWEANCWGLMSDAPYFGGNTFVGLAWDGTADAGTNINADCLQAFNYFRSPGILKRWTMMRPILRTDGSPAVYANVNVDFDTSDTTASLTFLPPTFAVWDSGIWDTAIWGGALTVQKQWQGSTGIGYCAAPRVKVASNAVEVRWVSTDLVMERGGIL